jgi:phosphatidylinositol glycan class Z
MTILSLIVDFCLLFISELCNLDESSVLITFSTSYIAFVYLTRTFSNSIETVLFAILMFLVLKSIKSQYVLNEKFIFDKKNIKKNVSTPKRFRLFDIYKFNYLADLIGLIICIGIFNRPTFIIFAFVPLAYWLFYGLDNCNFTSQMISFFIRRAISLCKLALPASILFVLIDTIYFYEIKNISQLKDAIFIHNKLVITPYNFFQYNSKSDNVKQHGEHPFYQHFLINCFILFGFNHLILIFVFIQFLIQFYIFLSKININNSSGNNNNYNSNSYNNGQSFTIVKKLKNLISKIYTLFINNTLCFLLFSFLFPVLVFSIVKHQEPRFLLPLIVPICLITSHCVFGDRSYTLFKCLWIIFNILSVIIYGYIHQGGMVSALSHIQKTFTHISNLEIDQHVIFYQTYMPPRYLVMAPVTVNLINNKRYVYEYKKMIENGDEEFDFDFDAKTSKNDKINHISPPNRFIYDLMSSSNYRSLEDLFDDIKKNYTRLNKHYAIFLVTPSVTEIYLKQSLNKKVNFELLTEFKFHFSFEHLNEYHQYLKCQFTFSSNTEINKAYINSCKKRSGLRKLIDCLNLNLYQIA